MSKHFLNKAVDLSKSNRYTTDRSITYNVLLVGDGWRLRNLLFALIKTSTNY
jgi:hypothetical protein